MAARWAVAAGRNGNWHVASDWTTDRGEAVARRDWFRDHAAPAVSYRLIKETTTVEVSVDEP